MAEYLQEMAASWPFGIFMLLLGACVGSFLNVCIHRLPAGKSIVWPPSHCTTCLAMIAWYDNIPIVSYLVLRGRCRRCGAAFSVRYMLVELASALMFLGLWLAYFRLGAWLGWPQRGIRPGVDHGGVYVVHMVLAAALLVSSIIDFERKEIYTSVTNVALAVGLVGSFVWPDVQRVGAYDGRLPAWTGWDRADAVLLSVVGGAVGAALIYVTRFLGTLAFRREAMGIGDVYLLATVGAVLGWEAAVVVFLAAPFIGLIYGLWHLARRKDSEVPYGPFLAAATGLVMMVQNGVVAHFRPGIEAMWQMTVG